MASNSGSFHAEQKRRRKPRKSIHSLISLRSLSLPFSETVVNECRPCSDRTHYSLNLYEQPAPAGFPSPADDYCDGKLDLNKYLIRKPAATFFVRVTGDSMTGAGIHDGDLLVVDRSLEAKSGRVVIAVINGEMTVKRLFQKGDRYYLKAENSSYPAIELKELDDLTIWGVVTSVVHLL
jgi:DNA polymerase V